MSVSPGKPTSEFEVLVNLGNRYVVFGRDDRLPGPSAFNAQTDSKILPRVADEGDIAERRIAETLQVTGYNVSRSATAADSGWDIELSKPDGTRIFVEIKVRERELKQRDFETLMQRLSTSNDKSKAVEVWTFNIEKLGLSILRLTDSLEIERLVPLDVWEKTEGGIFERARVVNRVADWEKRIAALYSDIKTWLPMHYEGMKAETNRTVVMSEEMMQKFAVPDRELPILDITLDKQPVISFVPRALWIIGARGRVDVITEAGTRLLVDAGDTNAMRWKLVSAENRSIQVDFNSDALYSLLGSHEQTH